MRKTKVLVAMAGRPVPNLGGQERRWGRLVTYGSSDTDCFLTVLINQRYHDLLKRSDVNLGKANLVNIRDHSNRLIDIIWKNIVVFYFSLWCHTIHLTTQGMLTFPAAMLAKLLLRRRLVFSYTGTSIDCHEENDETRVFAKRVKLISRVADVTEVLNDIVIAENWPHPERLVRAPCSFSDPSRFVPTGKVQSIVWAGHFYDGKGTDLLKEFLILNSAYKYKVIIYGSAIDTVDSRNFEGWLHTYQMQNNWLTVSRPDNMEGAYSKAWAVLSLQKISNYPSQVVLEALLSGCQVIMTDTGDSRLFNCPGVIHFISENASATDLIRAIEIAFSMQEKRFVVKARSYVLAEHTVEKYFDHLKIIWSPG